MQKNGQIRTTTYSEGLDLVGKDNGQGDGGLVGDGRGDQAVELASVAVDEDGGDVVGVEQRLLGTAAGPLGLYVYRKMKPEVRTDAKQVCCFEGGISVKTNNH